MTFCFVFLFLLFLFLKPNFIDFSERLWKDARIEMVSLGGWVARGVRRAESRELEHRGEGRAAEHGSKRTGPCGWAAQGSWRRRLEGAAGHGCKSLETHSHSPHRSL